MRRPFKILVLTLVVLFGVGEAYVAYLLWGGVAMPVLEVDKTEVDFGTLPANLKMTREVHITNRGRAPLVIHKVQTGCGCSEVLLSEDVVDPGKSTALEITLKGDGSITKAVAIYISSNDPQRPICKLLAKSNSITESFIEPKELDFGRIDRTSQLPSSRSFRLFLRQERGVDVDLSHLSVKADEPYIRIDDSKPVEGDMKEIRVSLLKGAPTGDIYSQLRLEDVKNSVSIQVNICGSIRGEYFAIPQMITFGPVNPRSQAIVENVVLKKRNVGGEGADSKSKPFDVESIELSESLRGILSTARVENSESVTVSATVDAKNYSGIWSNRQVSGRVWVQCVGFDGNREVLNIPVVVALRLPKIRDE